MIDGTVEVVSEGHWQLFSPDTAGRSADLGDALAAAGPCFARSQELSDFPLSGRCIGRGQASASGRFRSRVEAARPRRAVSWCRA
jgi:hypothetical protein